MFIVGMGGGLYGFKKNKLEMSVIGAKIGLNYKNQKKGYSTWSIVLFIAD